MWDTRGRPATRSVPPGGPRPAAWSRNSTTTRTTRPALAADLRHQTPRDPPEGRVPRVLADVGPPPVVTSRFLARAFTAIDRNLRKELRSARDGAPRSGGAAAPFGFAQGDRRRRAQWPACLDSVTRVLGSCWQHA